MLLKLSQSYSAEVQRLDLSRAKSALARCDSKIAEGCSDCDAQELRPLLADLLRAAMPTKVVELHKGAVGGVQHSVAAVPSASVAPAAPSSTGLPTTDGRGEVVLRIGADAGAKMKAAILEKVLPLSGVVSVAFEGAFIIVSTRSPGVAAGAGFLTDLLGAVQEHAQGVSLVNTTGGGPRTAAVHPEALSSREPAPQEDPARCPDFARTASKSRAAAEEEVEEEEGDLAGTDGPAYLDEQEEGHSTSAGATAWNVGSPGGMPGTLQPAGQFSFFSQTNWMTGRQIQEFGDDPTIAARLQRAKQREEEKRIEEEKRSKFRLPAWLLGGGR